MYKVEAFLDIDFSLLPSQTFRQKLDHFPNYIPENSHQSSFTMIPLILQNNFRQFISTTPVYQLT